MNRAEQDNVSAQRRRAVRTALLLAAVAVLIFIAFILTGVLNA